jgi:hypothetical protein
MASPYVMTNSDLTLVNCAGQDFTLYIAFMNPVTLSTVWSDLNLDSQGNWQAPPNYDTCANKTYPYAPTANLGSNRIGFVGEPLYFDGTLSCQRYDLPVNSYSWSWTGMPVSTTYDNGAQIALNWTTPGLYSVSLTVTDRYGATTTGTRQVMIYQDRDSALPGIITVSGLSGSLQNGGWSAQITTVNSQSTIYPPDQLGVGVYLPMVILCETRYEVAEGYWLNATIGPLGNFIPGQPYRDPRILFDGYVQNGSFYQDVDKDTLTFSCGTVNMVLGEMQTHLLGYYNTTVKTYGNPGVPTSLNTSSIGSGFLVAGLMSTDMIQSILGTHSQVSQYHDMHLWTTAIACSIYDPHNNPPTAWYNVVYSTLSVNEGTIWQNLTDICSNEWSIPYCDRDGSIKIGPSVNYRGSDYWDAPTGLGAIEAAALLNLVQDLGYTIQNQSSLSQFSQNLPILPAYPFPMQQVHPWSGTQQVQVYEVPFQPSPDSQREQQLQALYGPPLLCTFSDVPIYDTSASPPSYILPIIGQNWPQDLAIYPISFSFPMAYTGHTALVKLIGTTYAQDTVLTSWYPQSAFSVTGDGSSTIVNTTLPAGQWIVDESHLIGDVTNGLNSTLILNWFWEMARREWYANNIYYTGQVTLGLFTFASLNDIVGINRQTANLGPVWSSKPFYVSEIDYTIDVNAHTWQTILSLTEVTSATMGPPIPPPPVVPKY